MLQQTQVEQVIPYYERFLNKYPNLEKLARSTKDDVLKVWEGLGYYRRAGYIHDSAKILMKKHGGTFPSDYETLIKLPGFGPYTCGAVLSIAFNLPYPAVDGNVIRFISRLFLITTDTSKASTQKLIVDTVRNLIPKNKAGIFTQALMEMGALICTPRIPACEKCCCRTYCRSYNELADPSVLPVKPQVKKGAHIAIAAGIVKKGRRVLIAKRPANVILGNLWEFPGGKIERSETPAKSCVREMRKKTGLAIKPLWLYRSLKHQYSHYSITVNFYTCKYIRGTLKNKNLRWVKIDDLDHYAFSKVHKQIASDLMAE